MMGYHSAQAKAQPGRRPPVIHDRPASGDVSSSRVVGGGPGLIKTIPIGQVRCFKEGQWVGCLDAALSDWPFVRALQRPLSHTMNRFYSTYLRFCYVLQFSFRLNLPMRMIRDASEVLSAVCFLGLFSLMLSLFTFTLFVPSQWS
jgi:hypothetical protein